MELKMEIAQNLALSQRMIQSTEILQMSSQELETYVKELAVENPVVEIEEDYESPDKERDLERKLEWLKNSDEQNRVYYSSEYSADEENKDRWNFDENLGEDLTEYLLAQLAITDFTELEFEVINYMIQSLDSKGYLEDSLDSIIKRFNIPQASAGTLLEMIQSLDPAGVGARDLKECLQIQLRRNGMENETAWLIVSEYLELLGKNQLHNIAKRIKVPIEEVVEACDLIKSLNPKPGNCFSSREHLRYIIPDVTIVKLSGYFEILLNEYTYPKMSISNYYRHILKDNTQKEAKAYVSEKVKQAEWIMNCIAQRNNTLLNVTKVIIDKQEAFFTKGQGHLKPMKLADVAEVIGVHESTVSRAVRDKYLQCSFGVYPMNYFFSKGIDSEIPGGDKCTPEDIKNKIKMIVEEENKQKPFSDRIISEKLGEMGINISRRTVAKYREEINIKDASGRKSFI